MMNMLSSMSEQDYEISGNNILYGKLFDKLVEDFLTREDAEYMMRADNLPVSTTLNVNPGQSLSVAAATFKGFTESPGTGTGDGRVNASYKGEYVRRSTGTHTLEAKRKREKLTGQTQTEATTGAIAAASGGEIT